MRGEMQFKEERQTESVSYRWKQPKGKDRTNMKKEARVFEVYLAQWIGLEHREEVHEKIHRRVRYLPLKKAQMEKEGNGGAVQQRGQGGMDICSGCSENHR